MASTTANPLTVQFIATSLPVGGAETLLLNLVRRLDRERFSPEIVCLKEPGPLGELLAQEMPVHSQLIGSKFDVRVLWRLWRLMRNRKVDAVVTVAAGDNMFWGRLAAKLAGVPVVASALHSTGWPDGVGKLNRALTPFTDAFIAVADGHAEFLADFEGFPQEKVTTIYNGVDTDRFAPRSATKTRKQLGIDKNAAVVGILAALRPEKNHELFLHGAGAILREVPDTHFLIIGDGPRRRDLEQLSFDLGISKSVHFLGSRDDVPELLNACDMVSLTSHNEASPVSILEALSSGKPVVAAEVGSVRETVVPDKTGNLFPAGDCQAYSAAVIELLQDETRRLEMGQRGRRRVVKNWSLDGMTRGYEKLIERIYTAKRGRQLSTMTIKKSRKADLTTASS
ncbi:glycosyltransferase [Adhaeretor mobilis]|uniref:N, N'-diacetylbacillosaminyl-diphospho-undecaprenol alpha-1,3-N-acetylgalactosaminyltransferase n=1 Tax=Adhaeretor mobilis TaxID=1930276 RepID=A0A517MXF0_9BACT|nr:glycosyltransferase [Adhaeretor mobilis]QDS99539.1 N,N'-diacetylbacillosaminyl-diphospho-undecaprenol alpha-1,3-N-acetylgalactosaminyltransferase [Adhaeretor mobilis]